MSNSPYANLGTDRYWKTGVSERHPLDMTGIYEARFPITRHDRIATAGSCFAQHIARNLRARGCEVVDTEPAPPGLSTAEAQARGYGLYSARYGNIYTARQLLQLLREVFGGGAPADGVWEKSGRYYDSQRPAVEPGGFATQELVREHRAEHLARVRAAFTGLDLFIFTFGLTETWIHKASGTVFPTAPGTIAGSHDPAIYAFKNLSVAETVKDFRAAQEILREQNPGLRFLVTVSPVPLTATAAPIHVLQATTYSKAILRVACGRLYEEDGALDYFPSYELIAGPQARGFFYESNLRAVNAGGVEAVMRVFFGQHDLGTAAAAAPAAPALSGKRRRLAAARRAAAAGTAEPPMPKGAAARRRRAAAAALAAAEQAQAPEAKRGRSRQLSGDAASGSSAGTPQDDVVCEEVLLDAFAGGR